MQNGLYDVNWKIKKKKKIDQKNIKQKPLCVYCFLVKQKKLFGQLNNRNYILMSWCKIVVYVYNYNVTKYFIVYTYILYKSSIQHEK